MDTMENNEVAKQDLLVPLTPSKPISMRQKIIMDVDVHVGGTSPIKLFSDELEGKDQVLGTNPVPQCK